MGDKMTLTELIDMTRTLSRDTNGYMFDNEMVTDFINQGIDRLRQTPIFKNMEHLVNPTDVPKLLPSQYHYLLAIFASSRCFEFDERHYEGVDRRNEFESLFDDLMAQVESGNQDIIQKANDGGGTGDGTYVDKVLETACYIDYVTDKYFNVFPKDEDVIK